MYMSIDDRIWTIWEYTKKILTDHECERPRICEILNTDMSTNQLLGTSDATLNDIVLIFSILKSVAFFVPKVKQNQF